MIPRAKKKKKPSSKRLQGKQAWEVVQQADYLMLSVAIRYLYTVKGWRKKRIDEFLEGVTSILREIADGRSTVMKCVSETEELTGYNVKEIVDNAIER